MLDTAIELHHINFFFFNDTATTEIYTLSLHDALPICRRVSKKTMRTLGCWLKVWPWRRESRLIRDRKSTRLNSSHGYISYAVFCLKKTKTPPPTAWTSTPPSCSPSRSLYSPTTAISPL